MVPHQFRDNAPDQLGRMKTMPLSLGNRILKEKGGMRGQQAGRLLLLLSHFSRVQLCVTPSLGFSRQERWSGLPFPSPKHKSEK